MHACPRLAILIALSLGATASGAENDLPRRQPGEPAEDGAALFEKDLSDVLPGKQLPIFELPARRAR